MHNEHDSYFIESLVENLPHFIFWKDKNLVFRGCNKRFAQQFGYDDPKYIIGKTDHDFPWAPHLLQKYIKDDLSILNSGVAKIDYEEPQRQADGSIKTVLVSKIPVRNKYNEIIGIVGIYTDITDRKKAEALQKEKEIAEKTSRFMEMLAGSIAHELRTPLAIINVNLDLLELNASREKKDGFFKETLDVIRKVVKSAAYVVDNILITLRTLVSGKAPINTLCRLSMNKSVALVLANYPFENDEVDLIQNDGKNDFFYLGDNILTQHIFFNLIKNSLRAIKEAGKGKITISRTLGKKFNKLIFTDTASGIPTAYVSKIFDKFESSAPVKTGAGLGLAFCKMVMQSYGGDIVCTSKNGKYTKFTLSFPTIGEDGN